MDRRWLGTRHRASAPLAAASFALFQEMSVSRSPLWQSLTNSQVIRQSGLRKKMGKSKLKALVFWIVDWSMFAEVKTSYENFQNTRRKFPKNPFLGHRSGSDAFLQEDTEKDHKN